MKSTNSIYVTVKDPKDNMPEIKPKLGKEISKVKLIKDNKDGTKEYEITGTDEDVIRSKVFEVFPKEKIDIVELKKKEVSLEDAFLKVVNDKESQKEKETKKKQKATKERKEEMLIKDLETIQQNLFDKFPHSTPFYHIIINFP